VEESHDLFVTLDFVGLVLFLVAIGWLTGRILGVRRGFFRAVLAGLIGYGAGFAYVVSQFGEVEDLNSVEDALALGGGFVGYVLLTTMLASIAIEAILRPRSDRSRRHLPHPFRWVRRKFALMQRLWQIAAAARRNGLVGRRITSRKALSSPEGARALRLTLEECGGMFVKFGQIAASRDDLLPATVTGELAELRSSVKPLPADEVERVMRRELGEKYDTAFQSIEPEPLAAASIGVTHRAVLISGRRVIVKVQRPQIEEVVRRDSRVLLWGARQLERGSASAKSLGILDLCHELVRGVTEELDFNREAVNDNAMRRNRKPASGVDYPEVFTDLTSKQLLVMAEVQGRPIEDSRAVDATGVPRDVLADRLLASFLGQVLKDGVYHADPHPGNILVDETATMWFIDFGAVGHLDPITLEALQQMAIGFTLRDPGLLARAVRRLAGGEGEALDIPSLEFDMGQVLTQVEGEGFGPAAISSVVHVLHRHEVRVPRALTILGRAAVTMEGTLRELSPGYSMSHRAQKIVADDQGVQNARELLGEEALRALPAMRPLPQITEDLALQLRSGRLTLRAERYSGADRAVVDQWLDRVLWAAIGLGGLLGSAMLLIASQINPAAPAADYLRLIGFGGLVASSAMQMRTVARVLQRRDPKELG